LLTGLTCLWALVAAEQPAHAKAEAAVPAASGAAASASCPPVAQVPSAEQMRAAQAVARDRGFLWRITRDGRTSHLYGTIHVGKFDWIFPGPAVRAALFGSDMLALELDLTDPATMQQLAAASAAGPAMPALDEALRARIRRQAEAACLPDGLLDKQHPVMQAITLVVLGSRWDDLDPGYAQEYMLAGAARARRMPIVSLESVALQLRTLIPADANEALQAVTQVLDQLESGVARHSAKRLAQGWADGRLDDLAQYEQWCDCVTSEQDRAALRRINDERNPALAEHIEALHAGGKSVFAAVGALHMTGAQALPALLAKRGFTVERVAFSP
jgi:uncharacterized protein YbaP (TraB family)